MKEYFKENFTFFFTVLLTIFLLPPVVIGSLALTYRVIDFTNGICEVKK